MTAYHLSSYLVPAKHEETFTAELWTRGVLGVEIREEGSEGRLTLDAYFPDPLPANFVTWDLSDWRSRGVAVLTEASLEDRDWLEEYRASARPIEVGRRFLVDPRDEDDPSPSEDRSGRILLRIPARTAFGTGSHESTRLAVRWLEDIEPTGLDVLDVGTGSGILAFVALRLGARRVVGFDVDAPSVLVARRNRELNRGLLSGPRPLFFAGRLAALRERPAFDVALVNVLPERILDEVPRLVPLLRPGARVVSSGNLWSRRAELIERFASSGLALEGEKREGEWAAFLLGRPGN